MTNIFQTVSHIQQNPNQLKQLLYQNGKISQEQFETIQGMNSFKEIGEYLLNNNILSSPQFNQLKAQVDSMQKMIKK